MEESLDFPTQRGERLRLIREALRLTRVQVESKYGIPAASLKNWENARYGGLSEKGAAKLCEIFSFEGVECTVEWLTKGTGKPPVFLFPHSGTMPHFPMEFKEPILDDEAIIAELKLFHRNHHDAIDYVISDDSMAPFLQVGDIVAGVRYFPPFEPLMSKIKNWPCIIQSPEGMWVRIIEVSDSHYVLKSMRPQVVPIQRSNLMAIAPILWTRRKNCEK